MVVLWRHMVAETLIIIGPGNVLAVKPLPAFTYCDQVELKLNKFQSKYKNFQSMQCSWKWRLPSGGHIYIMNSEYDSCSPFVREIFKDSNYGCTVHRTDWCICCLTLPNRWVTLCNGKMFLPWKYRFITVQGWGFLNQLPVFSHFFSNSENTVCPLNITIFNRCRLSIAAVTPEKYECDLRFLTTTFIRSKFFAKEKSTNKPLVTLV